MAEKRRHLGEILYKAGLVEKQALLNRQELIRQYDREGIMATPANSSFNELVVEAARVSIQNQARQVEIIYEPQPGVRLIEY